MRKKCIIYFVLWYVIMFFRMCVQLIVGIVIGINFVFKIKYYIIIIMLYYIEYLDIKKNIKCKKNNY